MIPVPLPPEPDNFDERVRREGLAHLQEQGKDPDEPAPRALFAMKRIMSNGGERSCEYWQLAREDLRQAYHNRCVYSCFQIEVETLASGETVSMHSIDHFRPIHLSPARLAFDWSNLRLAWCIIDNHKGNSLIPGDHDPTRLQADALILSEDPSGLLIVAPNPSLPPAEQARLTDTVAKLGLNQTAVVLARSACRDDFIASADLYGHDFMLARQPFVYQFIFQSAEDRLDQRSPAAGFS